MDIGHGLMIDISAHHIHISMKYTLGQNGRIYSCCFFLDVAAASLHDILNEKSPSAHFIESRDYILKMFILPPLQTQFQEYISSNTPFQKDPKEYNVIETVSKQIEDVSNFCESL